MPDDAALSAHRKLPAENQLSETDAQQVEDAFDDRLARIGEQAFETADATTHEHQNLLDKSEIPPIDKGVLLFPEPRRIRDRDHT
jgi:hypothetical protein